MMKSLHDQILTASLSVDNRFLQIDLPSINALTLTFPVSSAHTRKQFISEYVVRSGAVDKFLLSIQSASVSGVVVVVDESVFVVEFVKEVISNVSTCPIVIRAIEGETKTVQFLEALIDKHRHLLEQEGKALMVIGGGLLLNVGSYIAERFSKDLYLFPTSVLSMADGSGGKVRVNSVHGGRYFKHFYKSFYEPNAFYIEKRFLRSLPLFQVRSGLVEIIKHALTQSNALYEYLVNYHTSLPWDSDLLLKAIMWTEDLKRVCIELDVDETPDGSQSILRFGHTFSDKVEEHTAFEIPHGYAVAIGICEELQQQGREKDLGRAKDIFGAFGIPITLDGFYKYRDEQDGPE